MPNLKKSFVVLCHIFISTLLFGQTVINSVYDIKKQAIGKKAMVVSAHPLASKIGAKIIKNGGNAVDAAIAVQFALAVVYPQAGNIGGGGFMVYRGKNGDVATLDYREMAPSSSSRNMYLDKNGNVIEGLSLNGHLAAGVPGSVDGMYESFLKYSKLKNWKKLVQPACKLAKKGFKITKQEADNLNDLKKEFIKYNTSTPVFVKEEAWEIGDILVQKDLANTLKEIKNKGKAGFYQGKVADLIVAEMKKGNGIITHEDLKNYRSIWRKPIVGKYRGCEIIGMPPPSSGGIATLQILGILENSPMEQFGFHSPKSVHAIIEAERRVYADRSAHLGDPDFFNVPIDNLLNMSYLRKRFESINPSQASKSSDIKAADFAPKESEQTTHLSIVDDEGNAVSITTTLNNSYGARTVVTGAGFILNDEMDDFSVKPGAPNLYGLVGGEANAVQPGKRMLSSMTPTIVTKDGKLLLVLGTPGGSTIITSVLQTIINVVDYKMNAKDATHAPRFHHQWLPDVVFIEQPNLLPEKTLEELKKMGHTFKMRGNIGRVESILVQPDGALEGAADKRGDDHAEGF